MEWESAEASQELRVVGVEVCVCVHGHDAQGRVMGLQGTPAWGDMSERNKRKTTDIPAGILGREWG